ncbi:hypothetical protein QBC42DRAFT_338622 [Cladorrhinum samala]|uniref:Extracellular membrane protein CFEM domain-containing protein n=1 Tax=Cladorrhinum samala TaxID=585594 RepID=A0AAV9HMR1_9PEZI|nr:hypothetical protein QBC42DRAFT_338622 [Cladorrhinum samala]
MLLQRMAHRPFILCLTIWITLFPCVATAQQTQTNNITDEILNFVPPCAQDCFRTFISANFNSRICGNSPSLQCLCRQIGSSKYTIGEGGVSCIVGESRFGSCNGRDATSDATSIAYNMCIGVSKAAPMTHSTLTATLLVPPTGTGPLIIPTPTRTRTTAGTTTTSTTAGPPTTSSTTLSSIPTDTPTGTTSSTSTATASPAGKDNDQPQLTSGQIAGISLGVAAVVILGVLLIFLARYIRKKRYPDLEAASGFAKIDDSGTAGKNEQNNRPASGPALQISGPLAGIPGARNPTDTRWYPDPNNPMVVKQGAPSQSQSQANQFVDSRWYPDPSNPMAMRKGSDLRKQNNPDVGLAISPLGAGGVVNGLPSAPSPSAQNRVANVPRVIVSSPSASVVLRTPVPAAKPNQSPPKPTLTLAIPNAKTPIIRLPAKRTDSVVTEFAEDGEVETAGTAVWRPPPSDPQSATALFFADKGGNWVMRSAAPQKQEAGTSKMLPPMPQQNQGVHEVSAGSFQAELPSPEHKTKAERAQEAYSNFSPGAVVSPLRIPSKQDPRKNLGSPIIFKDQRREPQVSRRNPAARSPQAAEMASPTPVAARPPADLYFSMGQGGRNLTGGRSRRRSTRRNKRMSQESSTSMESGAAAPFEDEAIIEEELQESLTPVAQSPTTPLSPGKSPVSYPRIPRPQPQPAMPNRGSNGSELLPQGHRYNVWHPGGHGGSTAPPSRVITPSNTQMVGPRRPMLTPPNRNPGQIRTGSPETRDSAQMTIEEQYFRSQKRLSNPASYWHPRSQQQRRVSQQFRSRTPGYGNQLEQQQQQQQQQYPQRQHYQQPQPQQDPHPGQLYHPPGAKAYTAYAPPSPPMTQTPLSEQSSSSSLLAKRRGADRAAALQLNHGSNEAYRQRAQAKWERQEGPSDNVLPPITPGWVPELTPRKRGGDLILDVR